MTLKTLTIAQLENDMYYVAFDGRIPGDSPGYLMYEAAERIAVALALGCPDVFSYVSADDAGEVVISPPGLAAMTMVQLQLEVTRLDTLSDNVPMSGFYMPACRVLFLIGADDAEREMNRRNK